MGCPRQSMLMNDHGPYSQGGQGNMHRSPINKLPTPNRLISHQIGTVVRPPPPQGPPLETATPQLERRSRLAIGMPCQVANTLGILP